MRVILYVQLMFGLLFVMRTLQIFRARALLSTSFVTKIGTTFVFSALLIAFFCAKHAFLCFCLLLTSIFIEIAVLLLCERRQIDTLKKEIPIFLDRWILNLRLGSALTSARESALIEHEECFQALIRPIFAAQNALNSKRAHLLFSLSAIYELERIHEEPHSALSRLENLRKLMRKSAEFRRKSGQALQQTYIQSVVMMILLIALIVFTLKRYGWHRTYDLTLIAVSLSSFGVLTMYILARKTKWKI